MNTPIRIVECVYTSLLQLAESRVNLHWHKPNLEEEYNELKRVADEENISIKQLVAAANVSDVSPLTDSDWDRLENTDSNQSLSLKKFRAIAKQYNRDSVSIENALRKNVSLPAPIVLHRQEKNPTLVSGNTRLMAAKALGIKPYVLHVYM